ncbi:ParM/StbA family protein [Cytobacillus kochii]|uniref:ParM/StbA family protein n=1 Tax=Cytobacillus kochii TaxID=859143 RepID=UPI002480D674|nr:ParM/StbA family protein [Cytobacillus kochii]
MVNIESSKLIGGYDSGNDKLKVSYLDKEGEIQSFDIATVIAEAPVSKVDLKSSKENSSNDLELLHVRVRSDNLNSKDRDKAWYVGEYAKNLDDKVEPIVIDENGKTEDKFSQQNKKLHLIPLFTGMAIAALRSNQTKVNVPFSGGLPIEDFKNRGEEQILNMIFGTHQVEFIDGVHEGKTVEIEISEGSINVEGVHSILGLMFTIERGEIKDFKDMANVLGNDFTINDLGAGTTDNALFKNGVLNKTLSTNTDVGTNFFIDEIIKKIRNKNEFEEVREYVKENESPYKTREEFIQTLIMPEVEKMINDEKYKPRFNTKWGFVNNVDVTDIVMEEMKKYADRQIKDLMSFWIKTNTEKMVVVGGGLLFGYYYLRDLKKKHAGFVFPTELKEAAYITSRSYLLANFMKQVDTIDA